MISIYILIKFIDKEKEIRSDKKNKYKRNN